LFTDLKELCSLTDGNLNRHLAVLEEAGLVTASRDAKQGRPQTVVTMTPNGRRRFQQYLNVLEQVLADAAASQPSMVKRGGVRGISPA
jgi:DNA-binding MarR family transcriptional regulator